MDFNEYLQRQMYNIFGTFIVWGIISVIITIAIWVGIIVLICKYLAKQISLKFDYDRLAQRTAEEICKRMLIIEKQRKETEETDDEEDPGYTKAFENIDMNSNA